MNIKAYIKILRFRQWVKNVFVLAPLLFSFNYDSPEKVGMAVLATLIMSFLASSVYIFNDIYDKEEDKHHPRKKKRPIASGQIRVFNGIILAFVLLLLAFAGLLNLPPKCLLIAGLYVATNIFYTLSFKHQAVLDVLAISSGFVFRILMGAYAIGVFVSPWILITTFFLALFLGFGKRRYELSLDEYVKVRKSLKIYTISFLDHLISLCAGGAIFTYALYAVEMAQQHGKPLVIYTLGFVVFGIFRYMHHLMIKIDGGDPATLLFKDKIFLINNALWIFVTLWILS